ncbi:MBL fold metallo-hydrolase [Tautonia rosea]|uniref:MBL fold metallo-hydrolase n=1 Tax=Tautonia rosea TaxID=2728037 RepID=UPI0014744CD1|nr:MBL fold metallo-hydrolase [Tautonia rosea]
MALEFTVLASGSKGNASLLQLDGSCFLVDAGLGPSALANRLEIVGAGWDRICGAIITHTHCDHSHDATLRRMARSRIPVFCHPGHWEEAGHRPGFRELFELGLLRFFDDRPLLVAPGLWVESFELKHSGPTFGFRFEGRVGRRGRPSTLGYLTDTGSWDHRTVEALADVDLLGIEFNHDVEMERQSGRSPALIWRNLGDRGHLSNDQAAELLRAILDRSGPGALTQVVMLHLSEHCNRPELAVQVARNALLTRDRRAQLHTASQNCPLGKLWVKPARRASVASIAGFPWEE